MAKPDDRSDNVDKLQDMIADTMENIRESRDYLKAHGDQMSAEQKAEMQAKNERREESIEGFRSEIKDEAHS
ncbi:small acid-soluble spore protein Tlp [Brevibacillus migulae]|uniref:small acid-soluble spore protein Tlp n=1 Tax=Brevibacillus migulae TaxID=1644114 RepID=UPI00106DDC4F|nr:small acid-soluble spore protein Tlp [Brevibacillus migulae]